MLIETKSVSELAIIFGSTWFTNSVVFAGILFMIFIANLVVMKFKPRKLNLFYVLLFSCIALNYFLPVSSVLGQPAFIELIFSAFYISLPLFFSAIIFALSFSRATNIPAAFGFNLLGIVFGGVLEYASLLSGFAILYLIAFMIYAASFVILKR
jgi:hypothetical protein